MAIFDTGLRREPRACEFRCVCGEGLLRGDTEFEFWCGVAVLVVGDLDVDGWGAFCCWGSS